MLRRPETRVAEFAHAPFASVAALALTLTLPACGGSDSTGLVKPDVLPASSDASSPPSDPPPLGTPPATTADASTPVPPGPTVEGCAGAKLLAVPENPGARGPWAVGARKVTIAGLTTEVWYPASPNSESGKSKMDYDIREHLPDADARKIPDADNPLQPCDCYRDLPLDDAHGPYPVVVFVHGTAAFRTQSLTHAVHWASRGFVVLSSDHPGIRLKDVLAGGGFPGASNQKVDAEKVLDAIASPSGPIDFLKGHIDSTRIGLSGHSAGGSAIAGLGSRAGVRVLMPLASGGTQAGSSVQSTLVMGGQDDMVARFQNTQNGYQSSPKKKRLVGILKAGHLAFSDLCFIGRDKGGILKVAQDNGVNVPFFVATLARDGCKGGQLAAEKGWAVINYATAATLEETLACSKTAAAQLAKTKATFTDVGEYKEDL